MNIQAVICEYNPLHKGHQYQLSEMKKEGPVIALMSGSFTQRGTPAVISKYERAAVAILAGADLVLELPFPFSCARADIFGGAGVAILSALGGVKTLCFGSESADEKALKTLEMHLKTLETQGKIDEMRKKQPNLSHFDLLRGALPPFSPLTSTPLGSNDLLALSYLKALREQKSPLEARAIRRIGESYNGQGEGFKSATTIRNLMQSENIEALKDAVPSASFEALSCAMKGGNIHEEAALFPLFAFLMRTRGEGIKALPDTPEELISRMKKSALTAESMERFLTLAATKTLSPSRIRRAMLYALLDAKNADFESPKYTTVLAANKTGCAILADMRKTSAIPIVTKPADALKNEEIAAAFSLGMRADSIWELLANAPQGGERMMKESPRIL